MLTERGDGQWIAADVERSSPTAFHLELIPDISGGPQGDPGTPERHQNDPMLHFPTGDKKDSPVSQETPLTGEGVVDALAEGKRLSEAEFCAPTTAFLGQVRLLAGKADWVFAPLYLDHRDREKDRRRQFCYYTQYAPVLARDAAGTKRRQRILTPLLYYLYSPFQTKLALYRCLRKAFGSRIRFRELSGAYDRALEFHQSALAALAGQYRKMSRKGEKTLTGSSNNI